MAKKTKNFLSFTVPKRAISWNQIYQGIHWAKRKKIADEWHQEVMAAVNAAGLLKGKRPKWKYPIQVMIDVFMKHPIDADNVASTKFILDTLVTLEFIKDDSPKYIRQVTTSSQSNFQDVINVQLMD